jgi:hypothetical protein
MRRAPFDDRASAVIDEVAPESAWWAQTDFHGPRQGADGTWSYTCRANGRLGPIGYCTPTCRHASPEDAEEHYRQYLIDSAQYGGRWMGKEYQCEVCRCWTDRFAVLRSYVVRPLCLSHLNRDGLAQLSLL